jgi:hypothetical protein
MDTGRLAPLYWFFADQVVLGVIGGDLLRKDSDKDKPEQDCRAQNRVALLNQPAHCEIAQAAGTQCGRRGI